MSNLVRVMMVAGLVLLLQGCTAAGSVFDNNCSGNGWIEPGDDGLVHDAIQGFKLRDPAALRIESPGHRHQHHIVMAMAVRVIALPEHEPVLLRNVGKTRAKAKGKAA